MISAEDFLKSNSILLPQSGEQKASALAEDEAGRAHGQTGHAQVEARADHGENSPERSPSEHGSVEEPHLPSPAVLVSDTWVEDAHLHTCGWLGSHAGDSAAGSADDETGSRRTRSKRRGRRRYPVREPKAGGFGAGGMTNPDVRADADDVDACREAALTLLDAAARSSGALAQRLSRKGFDEPTIEQVIARLTRLCLLDDRSYAQDLLRSCLHRTMGERGVLNEMTRKGLNRTLSEEVIAQAAEEGLFVDSAYELGRKVAKRTEGLDLRVRKRRLWSAGSRKGHDPSLLTRVANDLLVESD